MGTRAGGRKVSKGSSDADVGVARSRSLLELSRSGRLVAVADKLLLYGAEECCEGACKRNSKLPTCFCGFIPAGASTREGSLWARAPKAAPEAASDTRRADELQPVGLNNLGATCYVNAVLQMLFCNVRFRASLYALDPASLQHLPALRLLRELFAQLQSGRACSADPSAFAAALALDRGVQQDGQEFLKLLLQLVESALGPAGDFVPQLFRGRTSRGVTCRECGSRSAASAARVDCYELELNVRGCPALDVALADYLAEEELSGENAYVCDSAFCGGARRTAMLATRLHGPPPPLLCLSLKRFVFDPQTCTRKKVTDRFAFPEALDLAPLLTDEEGGSPPPPAYRLAALLLHRGSAATSGHYVAHVRLGGGAWWRFDDETVTSLGNLPLGEPKPPKAAADEKKGKGGKQLAARGSRETRGGGGGGDDDAQPAVAAGEVATTGSAEAPPLSSTEAYLLLYERVDGAESSPQPPLPPDLQAHVRACDEALETRLSARAAGAGVDAQALEARRARVRDQLQRAPPPPDAPLGETHWISAAWLMRWAREEKAPGPIDQSPLICPHGRLDMAAPREGRCKRITSAVWAELLAAYGGGPELGGAEALCDECLRSEAEAQQRRERLRERVDVILGGDAPKQPPPTAVWVERQWLRKWRSWAGGVTGAAALADGPTHAIACEHGALVPGRSERVVAVDQEMWVHLTEDAACARTLAAQAAAAGARNAAKQPASPQAVICIDVDGAEVGGGEAVQPSKLPEDEEPIVMSDTPPARRYVKVSCGDGGSCLECSSGCADVKAHRDAERGAAARFLGKALETAGGACYILPLAPQPALVALPAAFMSAWRSFMTSGRERPQPSALDSGLLLCEHNLLAAEPPAPTHLRGNWVLAQLAHPLASPALELVTEAEAAVLLREYCAGSQSFPTARVEGAEPPKLTLAPLPCADCLARAAEAAALRAADFRDANVIVAIIRMKARSSDDEEAAAEEKGSDDDRVRRRSRRNSEPAGDSAPAAAEPLCPRSAASAKAQQASLAAVTPRGRASARATRGGAQARALTLSVDSTDLVLNLKLRVHEATGANIISLWLNGRELADPQARLGAAGVTAGSRLACAVGEEGEDAVDMLPGSSRPAEAERGFAGTALHSRHGRAEGAVTTMDIVDSE